MVQMAQAGTSDRNGTPEATYSAIPKFGDSNYAAVILAGGDGLRLSSFTREIYGHHIPKQFCPLFKGETLLERTQRRVSLLIPAAQTITVLNHEHEQFYSPLLRATPPRNLVTQPKNRGTAPAILYALRHLIEDGHTGPVAIFPSDHQVSDDFKFMLQVAAALSAVELSPQLTLLLGITPDEPASDYGWIEPGTSVDAAHPVRGQISRIRSFWEKPSPAIARDLYHRGCLWNSFVLVANARTLLSLIARALPAVYREFIQIRSFLGIAADEEIVRTIYRDLPSVDFSAGLVAKFPAEFSVLPVTGISWSDLGDPKRLLAAISSGDGRKIFGGNQNVPRSQTLEVPAHQERISWHKAFQSRR
jgi:mannose-1-phosphate guanylyltransferase